MRSMTEGAAAAVRGEHDACGTRDAMDVAEDVLVWVQSELRHGNEAAVHCLWGARADAVVVRHIQRQLKVGAIIQGSAGENVLRCEGEDLVAAVFDFAQARPVVSPVLREHLAAFHADDCADQVGDPRDKSFEGREPWGFAFLSFRGSGRVIHARSIWSGMRVWDGRYRKTRFWNCRALVFFGLF